jgi:predicted metalloprotease
MTQQLGAPGQFAHAYVIGHEVGHHVQNLLGIIDRVDAARSRRHEADSNALSVKLELQADCLAGVWANRRSQSAAGASNRVTSRRP